MSNGNGNITAADFLPTERSMPALKRAAATCRGCELYKDATQTVFGEGRKRSRLMLVGEMPGDEEDLAGAARFRLRPSGLVGCYMGGECSP